ncbi:MAG: hypothetical protein Q9173_001826 [Seirophora scorigena]
MPYHFLDRPQRAKNNLFYQPSDIVPPNTKNRVRSATKPPFTAKLPVPSGHLLPRAPDPDDGSSYAKPWATARPSPWLTGMFFTLIIIIFARAGYLAYKARIQSAAFGPRPSAQQTSKKARPPAKFPTRGASHDHDAVASGAPAWNFCLNKRREAPPPALDLEALKPHGGVRRGWRDFFLLAVPETGNAFILVCSKGQGWERQEERRRKTYSAGALPSLTAKGLLESVSLAVRGRGRESLVSRGLSEKGGRSVLPVAAEDKDGDYVEAWQIF